MSSDDDTTTFERLKKSALDHRWLAVILFVGAVVIAIGAFSDALLKIGDLFDRGPPPNTTAPTAAEEKPNQDPPIQETVSIDAVTKVIQSDTNDVAFDVTVRNATKSPVAITETRFDFDEHLSGVLSSVQDVSGVYVVSIDKSGAVVDAPTGKHEAYAWYPNPDGKRMIVKSPLAQTVAPNTVDRFRLVFSGGGIIGPLERVRVALTYNGDESVRKRGIALD